MPEYRNPGAVDRFVHWLCGGPFQELPPQYGDTVPPELRAFTARTGNRHASALQPAEQAAAHRRSRPMRHEGVQGRR